MTNKKRSEAKFGKDLNTGFENLSKRNLELRGGTFNGTKPEPPPSLSIAAAFLRYVFFVLYVSCMFLFV
jgi:hypothetical protein